MKFRHLRPGTALLVAGLAACGGGGNSPGPTSSSTAPPTLNGSLVDFSVAGLTYSTLSLAGTTSSAGGYSYRCETTCETLYFRIGGILLGAATGASSLSLREMQGGISDGVLSEATIRRAQLLIALDADADPGNGIALPAELTASLANRSLDFGATSFDSDLVALIDFLRSDSRLPASYRSALQVPSRTAARALAEQAEAVARGVLIETPTAASVPVSEIRKYVLRVPEALLATFAESAPQLKAAYPRGVRPAVGAGLMLFSAGSAGNVQLRTVTSRGVAVPAPRYFDGLTVRNADVLLGTDANGLPSLGTLSLSSTSADLGALVSLRATDGTLFSGRPTPTSSSGSDGNRNLDESLQPRSPEFDQRGVDPAGLAPGDSGSLWVCDRRGPFLMQFDSQGRAMQRLGPAGNAGALPDVARTLPAILESRQPGLGCGGVAVRTTSGEVLFALGAALDISGRTANSARLIRLVGLNPRTGGTRQFGMPIRSTEFALRVLDLESLDEQRILALVRYRDGSETAPYRWEVRTVDLTSASDLSNRLLTNGPNSGLAPEYGSSANIDASGITLATFSTVLELGALGWIAEDAEGLARINAQTLVVIGQANGGVTSRIVGGNPDLNVAAHQVDRNGFITPRATGGSAAPIFELLPMPFESRRTLVWSLQLRTALN